MCGGVFDCRFIGPVVLNFNVLNGRLRIDTVDPTFDLLGSSWDVLTAMIMFFFESSQISAPVHLSYHKVETMIFFPTDFGPASGCSCSCSSVPHSTSSADTQTPCSRESRPHSGHWSP